MLATRVGLSLSFLRTLLLRAARYLHSPRVFTHLCTSCADIQLCTVPSWLQLASDRHFRFWIFWDAELSSRRINFVATVYKSSVLFGSWLPELPHQLILVRIVDLGVVPKNPIQTQTQLGYLQPQRFWFHEESICL